MSAGFSDEPFFATRQQALLAEIAGWEGTRFWPGCGAKAKKGVGADCVSFVERVLVNTGAIQPVDWPRYVAVGGGERSLVLIVRTIDQIPNVRKIWKPGAEWPELLPGDFLLRSYGDDHYHLALYGGDQTLWNMRVRRGVCRANLHDKFALKKVRAIYRVYESHHC